MATDLVLNDLGSSRGFQKRGSMPFDKKKSEQIAQDVLGMEFKIS